MWAARQPLRKGRRETASAAAARGQRWAPWRDTAEPQDTGAGGGSTTERPQEQSLRTPGGTGWGRAQKARRSGHGGTEGADVSETAPENLPRSRQTPNHESGNAGTSVPAQEPGLGTRCPAESQGEDEVREERGHSWPPGNGDKSHTDLSPQKPPARAQWRHPKSQPQGSTPAQLGRQDFLRPSEYFLRQNLKDLLPAGLFCKKPC